MEGCGPAVPSVGGITCGNDRPPRPILLGTAPSAVSDWESGKKDPSVSNLWRIVAACGLDLRMHAAPVSRHEQHQRDIDHRELASGRPFAHDVGKLAERFGIRSARAS